MEKRIMYNAVGKYFVSSLIFLGTISLSAQHVTMPIVVHADRIDIGSEFVPRFLNLPVVKNIPFGITSTLNAGTYDYVEVEGTLNIPSIEIRVTHLFVLPGGSLNIACGATIIGRDVLLDPSDVFQWGNGLLNFGSVTSKCGEKTPFVAIGDAPQNSTVLLLKSQPIGWQVGDEVMLPDTRQMKTGAERVKQFPVREPNATITAISDSTVTISTPLAFARNSIKRPDGSLILEPRVANLTRPTTIKSENPLGTRWHVAHIGIDSSWDIEGIQFIGTGRTKNIPLDPTTNHIGRYAAHHAHHAGSSLEIRRFAYNSINGLNGGKWGVAIHQTHDSEIIENVCVDLPSGCFVTEDGNEVRNLFRGNFVAFAVGNGNTAQNNVKANCAGCESGYWFRGVHNIFEANEAWNSQAGLSLFHQAHLAKGVPVPISRGSEETYIPVLGELTPILFTNNIVGSNTNNGMEYWSVLPFSNTNFISAHNGRLGIWNAFPERTGYVELVDGKIICSESSTTGMESAQGYAHGIEMVRGEIRGCNAGIIGGIGKNHGRFTDTIFQNVTNIPFIQRFTWPYELFFKRVKHEVLGTNTPRFITSPSMLPWSGTGPYPSDTSPWTKFETGSFLIENWQGTGNNYRLAYPAQINTALAWPTRGPNDWMLPPPECGTNIGTTWNVCGITFGGEGFNAGTESSLPGVINFVALTGSKPTSGIPKAIMSVPNSLGAFTNKTYPNGTTFLNFILTGDMSQADNRAYLSIDNGPRRISNYRRGGSSSIHYVGLSVNVITSGTHIVRTWRELNGVEVPGSSMTFSYVIP